MLKYYTIQNPPRNWNKERRKALLYLLDYTRVSGYKNIQWFSEEPWNYVLCNSGSGPYLNMLSFTYREWTGISVNIPEGIDGKVRTW